MGRQFTILVDVYKAEGYRTGIYAIRDLEFAYQVFC
jgi:hypothetical protein